MKLFSAALLLCSLLLSSSFLEPVMAKSSFCASCANAGIQDRCLKYCGICGEQCKCVPSGTYGKKHECPSGTYRNKHECPFETYQCPCYRDKHECPNMESTRRFHHRMISSVLFKPIVWLAICTAIPVLCYVIYNKIYQGKPQTGTGAD